MAKRTKSLVSHFTSDFKKSLILAGGLAMSVSLAGGSALAAELEVADKVGSSFLRVDAAEGATFNLLISFKNSDLSIGKEAKVTLSSNEHDEKIVALNSDSLKNGALVENLKLGSYTVSTQPENLEISEIKVVDSLAGVKESDSGSLSSTTYAVGAAGIAAGVLAVSAGGDSLDVFNSSGGSSASTARDGSGTGSGSSSTSGTPEVGALSTSEYDPNFPTNNAGFDAAPDTIISNNSAPPARDNTGSGGQPPSMPANDPAGSPTVAPAPPITNPMTPS